MSTLKVPVTDNDHILGNKDAPITLVEYGDYQCPACGLAFPITKLIQKNFGDKLRFVFRHFPLTDVHPYAEVAAETAEFASDHGKFWEMHDHIYMNQNELALPLLFDIAKKLNLTEKDLENALQNSIYKSKIKSDFLGGIYSEVNATPTFFINGHKYEGSFENLSTTIEEQLVRR